MAEACAEKSRAREEELLAMLQNAEQSLSSLQRTSGDESVDLRKQVTKFTSMHVPVSVCMCQYERA